MHIPVVTDLRELTSAPRKFLAFSLFNVVSWQCLMGTVLVLFARHIGMEPRYVGFLIAFMPLSSIVVVLTIPLVGRFGPKPVMFTAWLTRTAVVCTVFTMPWVIFRWGYGAAGSLLMAATLGFCVIRAMGVGAWFPWLHEVLSERERGPFFAVETLLVHSIALTMALVQAALLRTNPSLDRFLLIYGIGAAAGFISLIRMLRIPGGHHREGAGSFLESLRSSRAALSDPRFLKFVTTASLSISSVVWLASSVVLYMRDQLLVPSWGIMACTGAGSSAILLTIRFWLRYVEHSGSGRTMFKTLLTHSTAALLFLALVPGAPWTLYALAPVCVCGSIAAAAFFMATNRAMLNHVRASNRIGYSGVWMTCTSLAAGLTPIAVGAIIDKWGLLGFRVCFLVSGVAGLLCAIVCLRVVRDGRARVESLSEMLTPVMPLRTLARVAWITLGMHESNWGTGREADRTDDVS